MLALERALKTLLLALAGSILIDQLALMIVHVHTLYAVNQTSGAWLSFAYYAREGVLYPPLADGGYYAGTRYFPGFFLAHATLAKATGEFLISGKLLTYVSAIALFAGIATALNARTKNPGLALALAATIFATFVGHKASMTIRGDVFPAAISIAALVLLERAIEKDALTTRRLIALAALCALPPLAKFTSFHALTAGALYLFLRDKKRGVLFGAIGFLVFAAGVALTELASHGHFFESLASAATAPASHKRSAWGAIREYAEWIKYDRSLLVIFALALWSLARTTRPFSVWRIYFILQLVISVGFFFDTGAEYNHLIDLLAASIILAGELAIASLPAIRVAALSVFCGAATLGLVLYQWPAWEASERGMDVDRYFAETLDLDRHTLLAHDPSVAVLSGRRPIVADDFQYRVLVWRELVDKEELPERVKARAFERIVLLNPAEPRVDDPQFEDVEFGSQVARAIREHYVLERHVDRFYVYRPK